MPHAFLERLLAEQVFTEPGGSARVVAVADPCNAVVLSNPRVAAVAGRLVVRAHGRAGAGFSLGGGCVRPFSWQGEVEVEEEARVAPDGPVVLFRVADTHLYGAAGALDVPAVWDWVKPAVHPRLETLRVDLSPLVAELRAALPLFAARAEEPALARLVDSLALEQATVEERGLVLRLRFDVESTAPAGSAATEAALTPEELAAFEQALREWDAFLTFVVKTAGQETLRPELRGELLAVLLDARHELVAALETPAPRGPDPVRALFVSAWTALSPVLLELAGGDEGARWLAFLAAGDALAALDEAGPAFGVEISSNGLRRLARAIAPEVERDPLEWSSEVDPALRETFGFGAELPVPPAEPAPSSPAAESTPLSPQPAPSPSPAPQSRLPRPYVYVLASTELGFGPPPAFARARAQRLPAKAGPQSSPLDGFAPRLADLDDYLPKVAALLRDAARDVARKDELAEAQRASFRSLVLATAWQESCWRQYVRRRGKMQPLRSSIGALGLMQVSPRVWRGFYAVNGLSWSISYNARAGSEILLHYLGKYAIPRGEEVLGGADALARATYAAYHGGPSHLRRYREPKRWRKALVEVDRAFHQKYRDVLAGNELGVRGCFPG